MTDVKPWPNPDDFYPPKHLIPYGSSPVDAHVLRYQRALADAWESRARVAVEALNVLAAQDSGKPGSTARADCMAVTAKLALSTIGPLPELPVLPVLPVLPKEGT